MWIYLLLLLAVALGLRQNSSPRRDLAIVGAVTVAVLGLVIVQQGLLTWRA
jgi:hypothetical protein